MPHKKILFLISLPDTQEFKKDKEDIEECLKELQEQEVDVREHIRPEDLADANYYDIVIVVAHHDTDSGTLVLADGIMSLTEFIDSLPSDFKGIIDFSSCHSITAFQAIKEHCPSCKVQVALKEVPLLRRIIMYPSVVELFQEDETLDYESAYNEVSKDFDNIVDEVIGEQDMGPKMSCLGQKRTSIFAPESVKRKSLVPIQCTIHYDSEVKIAEKDVPNGTKLHTPSNDLGIVNVGDILEIKLSFIPNDGVQYLHLKTDNPQSVTVTDDIQKVIFIIKVGEEFDAPNFGCYIDVIRLKDNKSKKFCLFIDVDDYISKINSEKDDNTPKDEVIEDEKIVLQLVREEIFKSEIDARKFIQYCRSADSSLEVAKEAKRLVKEKTINKEKCKRPLWTILYNEKLYSCKEANWDKRMP